MDIHMDGHAYGIIYVRTYGWTNRQTGRQLGLVIRKDGPAYGIMYVHTDGRTGKQIGRLSG